MALSSKVIKELLNIGGEAAIREAKALGATGVKKLEDIPEEIADKILAPKGYKRATVEAPIPEEEIRQFGESIDIGSDVSPRFRETATSVNTPTIDSGIKLLGPGKNAIPMPGLVQEGSVRFSPEGIEPGVPYNKAAAAPETLKQAIDRNVTPRQSPVTSSTPADELIDSSLTGKDIAKGALATGAGLGALAAGINGIPSGEPLTPEQEARRQRLSQTPAGQRILKEEEMTSQAKARQVQKELDKKERMAKALGLSEEEKAQYIGAAPAVPSPANLISSLAEAKPMAGVGPIASGKEYGTLLDKLKPTAKEEPKKTSALKEAVAAAPMAPSPTEPTPSPYEQSMAELKGERATAKAERDADLRRAEIGELASIIGQSLTQIGAAASGMRSGVDMSGIAQKALVDWDKRKDQVMNLYKQNVAELDGQQAKLERAKERADDKVEKEAYQKAQMKLAREKMQQDKDIAAQNNQLKMLAAIATKNDKAIKDSETQYTRNLAKLDKRESDLRKVEELNILNKTKEVIAGELASLLGEESVKEEGIFYGENILSKDDLMKLVADKKAEIRQERDQVYKNLETLTAYQVRANAPKAAAPAPAAQASAGQPPSADDMVRVELEGKELRMPRANLQAAKNKYPNLKVLE